VRLAHFADLHISGDGAADPATGRDRRRERLRRAWLWACRDAVERRATHAVVAGDAFDSPHPEPADCVALAEGLQMLLAAGVHCVIDIGNHDVELAAGRQNSLGWLGITRDVLGRAQDPRLGELHIFERAEVASVGGETFVGIPHPHRRALDDNPAVRDAPIAQRGLAAGAAVERIIDGLAERAPRSILVAHVTVVGAKVAAERAMQLGWDITVSRECLEPFAYAALGHIHRYQRVGEGAFYAGPIERLSFSDEDIEPGYVFFADARAEHIAYPEATRYLTLHWPDVPEVLPPVAADVVRITGPRERAGLRLVEEMRRSLPAAQVFDATTPVRAETSPAPDVTTAVGPDEALETYMAMRPPPEGIAPEEARARLAEIGESA
jgi:DNA repair exonuclease SbcCD nuclease subunit